MGCHLAHLINNLMKYLFGLQSYIKGWSKRRGRRGQGRSRAQLIMFLGRVMKRYFLRTMAETFQSTLFFEFELSISIASYKENKKRE